MGILINQGVQDTTQDNKFQPIVEKNVLAQITEIKLADSKKMPNTLEITFRILQGAHKSRFFWDRVTFDPKSNFSWKYRSLRKAAGVPYSETEPKTVDIEALLLNKAILVDLGIRLGKNKDGEETAYQNVIYRVAKTDDQIEKVNVKVVEDFEEVLDEEPVEIVKEPTLQPKKAKPQPKVEPAQAPAPDPTPAPPQEPSVPITDDDDWAD
ncbi:MAG: hypothetical protein WC179_08515 [Candidatus Cloacimonadaceae bacterium]